MLSVSSTPLSPHSVAAETDSKRACELLSRIEPTRRPTSCAVYPATSVETSSSDWKLIAIVAPGGATGDQILLRCFRFVVPTPLKSWVQAFLYCTGHRLGVDSIRG